MNVRFYKCAHCGKIIFLYDKSEIPTVCCGEAMTELVPSTSGAQKELHLPVARRSSLIADVSVGGAAHPMTADHRIEWIYLETENGGQIRYLKPGGEASALFALHQDEAVSVYAYCSMHGLWASRF
jgi:superoxide reductase